MTVLAATNWTAVGTAAVTGLTAIVVGVIGYLGTRASTAVGRAQIDADTRRVESERTETRRAERQKLYQALLNHERRFFNAIDRGQINDRDELHAALNALYDEMNGVVLLGPHDVAEHAIALHRALRDMCENVDDMSGSTFGDQVRAAFDRTSNDRIKHRRALIDAMRSDVASDTAAISWA